MVNRKYSIGVMQGRLTIPNGRGIQFFPFEEWEDEFKIAKHIGFDEIEWVFDYLNYQNNPLWTLEGQRKINHVISKTKVVVKSVCLHYFINRAFYKFDVIQRDEILFENKNVLKNVIFGMNKIGASILEIPIVDGASVLDLEQELSVAKFIRWACDEASKFNIQISIESDFESHKLIDFLQKIDSENLTVCYDMGNIAGLGYHQQNEILNLKKYINNVHVKDKIKCSSSVMLGTGDVDFKDVNLALKEINYNSSFILEASRGEAGRELETVQEQFLFFKRHFEL